MTECENRKTYGSKGMLGNWENRGMCCVYIIIVSKGHGREVRERKRERGEGSGVGDVWHQKRKWE